MRPLFTAILHFHPDYDFTSVDVITDRWAFSQLLSHFGKLRDKGAAFGFQAQVIGNTVVFMSNDAGNAEVIGTNPRSFRGFRDNFGAEYLQCRADCADSVSHYGIVEYDLDGIKILLRHKVNGFLDEKAPEALIDLLSLEVPVPGDLKYAKGDIVVRSAGCLVTQAAHLELSTAKSVNTVEKYLEKEIPEQWISQTPNFIRVVLDYPPPRRNVATMRAVVKEIEVRDAKKDVCQWVDHNQDGITKFHGGLQSLLVELRDRSVSEGRDMYVIHHEANESSIRIVEARPDRPRLAVEVDQVLFAA
ncbi:hypothetical protein LTR86_007037 [Recurvomyces mirabilis]|nr:hypothetical protein LTR86_007037 [Recurvomyces mirabilis]